MGEILMKDLNQDSRPNSRIKDSESFDKFCTLTFLSYHAITAPTEVPFEQLYYDLLKERERRYKFKPKKKKGGEALTEEDKNLFEFLDYFSTVLNNNYPLFLKKISLEDKREDSAPSMHQFSEQNTKSEAADCEWSEERVSQKVKKGKRSHRSRPRSRRNKASDHGSHNSSSECTKDEVNLLLESKESRKKKEQRANVKRKKDLESTRSELLEKYKKVSEEKEVKKSHIMLPREIIPKNIKMEIERQQKEAERRKRDFERRARMEEAKALKLKKKTKKAEKRNQAVLTEDITEEDFADWNSSSTSNRSNNASATVTSSSSIETDTSEGRNLASEKETLLERHLQAYHQLMKVQPERHTTQQLEEERKRLQEEAAKKQQEELRRLRAERSNQPCGKVSDNERKALLEKLREKERQRNLEELANSNSQIKRARNSDALSSIAKTSISNQRRAGKGDGRPQTHVGSMTGNKIAATSTQITLLGTNTVENSLTWRKDLPNKSGKSIHGYLDSAQIDQSHPLCQEDCNLPSVNKEVLDCKLSSSSRFAHQPPLPYNKAPTELSIFPPALCTPSYPINTTMLGASGLPFRFASPMTAPTPVQHSTPFHSKPLSIPVSSKPMSYSDCLKHRQSAGPQSELETTRLAHHHGSQGMAFQSSTQDSVCTDAKTFPEKVYHFGNMQMNKDNISNEEEEMQLTLNDGKKCCSEKTCSNDEPTTFIKRKYFGGAKEAVEMHAEDLSRQISSGKGFLVGLTNNFNERDKLLPAPSIDDWMKARKAGHGTNCDSNKFVSTLGSFNNTSLSIVSSLDIDISQFSKSSCPEDLKGGIETNSFELHSTKNDKDFLTSSAVAMNGTIERADEGLVSTGSVELSNQESEDHLIEMLNHLSLTSEFRQSSTEDKSNSEAAAQGQIQKTEAISSANLTSESCRLHTATSSSRHHVSELHNLNTTPDSLFSLPMASLSFPAGVHSSSNVQDMALSLQQQQLMLMSHALQNRMMMLASAAAAQPAQELEAGRKNSNTNGIAPSGFSMQGVKSSNSKLLSSGFDSNTLNSVSQVNVTCTSKVDKQTSLNYKARTCPDGNSRSLTDGQARSLQCRGDGKYAKQELSDQDIKRIMSKFSSLTCDERYLKMSIGKERLSHAQTVRDKDKGGVNNSVLPEEEENWLDGIQVDSMPLSVRDKDKGGVNNSVLPEEEENWLDGIQVDSIPLPHRKTGSALNNFVRRKHVSSLSGDNGNKLSCFQSQPSSRATLTNLNNEEIELPQEKVDKILKWVHDLDSKPNGMQFDKMSPLDLAARCSRPLRKPTSAMRCKESANIQKSAVAVAGAYNDKSCQFESPQNLLPTAVCLEKTSGTSFRQQQPVGRTKESLKQVQMTNNGINSKDEYRNTQTQKRPDNPVRLMRAALLGVRKGNGRCRSRNVSSRGNNHPQPLGGLLDKDSQQVYSAFSSEKAQDPNKTPKNSLQGACVFGENSSSSKFSFPHTFASNSSSTMRGEHVSKKPLAPAVRKVLEVHTANAAARELSVSHCDVDCVSTGSKLLALPARPSISASRLMPKHGFNSDVK